MMEVMRAQIYIAILAFMAGGCGGMRDITHNPKWLANSPYQPGITYRITHDVRLAQDGQMRYLGNDPAHPAMDKGDVLISSGTRFRIDKVILDNRVTSMQYHPQGVLTDGPHKGRWVDLIGFEPGWAVEDMPTSQK